MKQIGCDVLTRLFQLSFLYFDVEPGPPACPFDYIEVYDGNSTELMGGSRLCGRDTPGSLISTSHSLKVKFHSDKSDTGVGAAFEFKIMDRKNPKVYHCDFNDGWCGISLGKNEEDLESRNHLSLESGLTLLQRFWSVTFLI